MEAQSLALDPIEVRLGCQAKLLQSLFTRLMKVSDEHALSDVELSHREIKLLLALGEPGEMIMTDLAAVIHAPLSTATRMVDRLEAKGLVERVRSSANRRIVVVRPSAGGRRLYEAIDSHHFQIARRMLEPLSFGEREILLELMAKLTRGPATGSPQ
jgi:DNA-binding MarR family transcriptional regulator